MDKKIILARIDELMLEKRISTYKLKENAEISSTIYQWKKNATRDKDRVPSLRSIEKICEFFGVTLSYFFAFDKAEQKNEKYRDILNLLSNLSDAQIDIIKSIAKEFNEINQ